MIWWVQLWVKSATTDEIKSDIPLWEIWTLSSESFAYNGKFDSTIQIFGS